jgi:arginase
MKNAATTAAHIEAREPLRAASRTPVRIVGVACGSGAPDPRCANGPVVLRKYGLVARLRHAGMDAAWSGTIPTPASGENLDVVSAVAGALAIRTEELVARGRFPVVLGGDHSCAIGTWKGIARALAASVPASKDPPRASLGLVWIDAHMDAHTAQTSESGKLHGMPLACLLGEGDSRLTGIADGARLDPHRVCLVGVRSFETGEAALLHRLGVRVFFMHDVERRGLQTVMKEAVAIAGSGGRSYGISLDLDAVDPRDAPGVGTPAPGGIRAADLLRSLARYARGPALAGLEITEYNPDRDRNSKTARLVTATIQALLAPRSLSVVSGTTPQSPSDGDSRAESGKRQRAA